MSTLEKIRQRPILIISILGLALLLFILTAVDRPGELFTDSHTVAKIDGEKIDYMDFQKRVEQQQEQLQQRGYTNVDAAQVQEYVLQQMVNETLMKKEYERLGLTVTDRELSQAMLGDTPHPYVSQMVQSMGIPSAQMFHDAAFNPTKNGIDPQQAQQLQQAWIALEKDTEEMLLQQKFINLFNGTLTANKLDAQAIYEGNASTSTIAYAKKDLSSLNDDEFPVSDSEINDLYKQEKNRYRITEPQHLVSYIAVDITPSSEDLAAAQKEVEDAIMGLRMNPGTDAVSSNTRFYVNRVSATEQALAPALKKVVPSMAKDSTAMVQFIDNQYTIAKLLDTTTSIDSVLLDVAFIDEKVDADSIIARLNTGAKVADLGDAVIQSQDSVWVSLLAPGMAVMKEELSNAATGTYFKPENNNGQNGMTVRVRSRKAPVTVYDVAEITYDVNPSTATINKLNSDLRSFITENSTADKFTAEAPKAGYSALSAIITPSSLSVNGLSDSRGAAKWALGAKKGQVSGIFNDDRDSRLLALTVTDIYDGDYVPVTNDQVRTYLTNKARNAKKADKLIADFKGKGNNVSEYAAAMQVKADTTDVTFGQAYVRDFGMYEANLQANVAAAKKGQTVGPIALKNSVVVFEVVNVNEQGRAFDFANDAMMFNQREGAQSFQRSLPEVLMGNKTVENRIQKFYSDRQ
ncbi:MAG: SurA N-terminal domain-containing protein [Muribaculaceae bacterium]|nr:SurA N-terminal domain-containing protein [Muribaculaceae bacterium]